MKYKVKDEGKREKRERKENRRGGETFGVREGGVLERVTHVGSLSVASRLCSRINEAPVIADSTYPKTNNDDG